MKAWYINTMEYYSAIMENKIVKFAGKWTELETIVLNEVTTPKKANVAYFLSFVNDSIESLEMWTSFWILIKARKL